MRDSDWLKIYLRLIFLICVQTQILCNGAHITQIIKGNCIGWLIVCVCVCRWNLYVSEALARFAHSHSRICYMYMVFSVHLGVLPPPPPPIPKSWLPYWLVDILLYNMRWLLNKPSFHICLTLQNWELQEKFKYFSTESPIIYLRRDSVNKSDNKEYKNFNYKRL